MHKSPLCIAAEIWLVTQSGKPHAGKRIKEKNSCLLTVNVMTRQGLVY
ncbi:hypothetical protein TRICHSKD4_1957 [Roseibium sp. TrichSKD4]|nr:hypothetical protein TRICHSKD4_1957 [Roseibium sp. TrichSKD4]